MALMRSVRRHMSFVATVYVALIGEGVDVWRPVAARELTPGAYLLEGTVPSDETWEFLPGQLVECEPRSFPEGESGLVAVRCAQ